MHSSSLRFVLFTFRQNIKCLPCDPEVGAVRATPRFVDENFFFVVFRLLFGRNKNRHCAFDRCNETKILHGVTHTHAQARTQSRIDCNKEKIEARTKEMQKSMRENCLETNNYYNRFSLINFNLMFMSSHTHDTIRRALLLSHRQCFLIVCILIRWYGGGCCCCSLLPLQLQCLSCLLCVYTKSHCECSARTRKRRRVKETARIDDDDGNNNNRQHTLASGENRHLCVSRAIDRKRETENTHRPIGTVRHLSSRRCTNWPKISHSHREAKHFYPIRFDVCCQSWQWTWRILFRWFVVASLAQPTMGRDTTDWRPVAQIESDAKLENEFVYIRWLITVQTDK